MFYLFVVVVVFQQIVYYTHSVKAAGQDGNDNVKLWKGADVSISTDHGHSDHMVVIIHNS